MSDSQQGNKGWMMSGLVLVLVFIALGAWGAIYSQFQTLSSTVTSQQNAIAVSQAKISDLESKLATANANLADIHQKLEKPKDNEVSLHMDYETVLPPGVWQGMVLGPSSDKCGYVAEISPLEDTKDGGFIEKYVIQPEFNGKIWNDVLRISLAKNLAPLRVNVRVYKVTAEKLTRTGYPLN